MTQTQVDYLKHLENVRHNKESEEVAKQQADAQTKQANVAEANVGATYTGSIGTLARGVGVGTLLGVALQKNKVPKSRPIGFTSTGAAIPFAEGFEATKTALKDHAWIEDMWKKQEPVSMIRKYMEHNSYDNGALRLVLDQNKTDEELGKYLQKVYGIRKRIRAVKQASSNNNNNKGEETNEK